MSKKIYTINTTSIKATPIGTLRNGASPKGHILSMAFRAGARLYLYRFDAGGEPVCSEDHAAGSAKANQIVSQHTGSFSAHE